MGITDLKFVKMANEVFHVYRNVEIKVEYYFSAVRKVLSAFFVLHSRNVYETGSSLHEQWLSLSKRLVSHPLN